VVVEHNTRVVQQIADDVLFLHQGHLMAQAHRRRYRDAALAEIYFGARSDGAAGGEHRCGLRIETVISDVVVRAGARADPGILVITVPARPRPCDGDGIVPAGVGTVTFRRQAYRIGPTWQRVWRWAAAVAGRPRYLPGPERGRRHRRSGGGNCARARCSAPRCVSAFPALDERRTTRSAA